MNRILEAAEKVHAGNGLPAKYTEAIADATGYEPNSIKTMMVYARNGDYGADIADRAARLGHAVSSAPPNARNAILAAAEAIHRAGGQLTVAAIAERVGKTNNNVSTTIAQIRKMDAAHPAAQRLAAIEAKASLHVNRRGGPKPANGLIPLGLTAIGGSLAGARDANANSENTRDNSGIVIPPGPVDRHQGKHDDALLPIAAGITSAVLARIAGRGVLSPAVRDAESLTLRAAPQQLERATRIAGRMRATQRGLGDGYAAAGGAVGAGLGAALDPQTPVDQRPGAFASAALMGAVGGLGASKAVELGAGALRFPGASRLTAGIYDNVERGAYAMRDVPSGIVPNFQPRTPITWAMDTTGKLRPALPPAEWPMTTPSIGPLQRAPRDAHPPLLPRTSDGAPWEEWDGAALQRARGRSALGAPPLDRRAPLQLPPPPAARTVAGRPLADRVAGGNSVGPHFGATAARGGYTAADVNAAARVLGVTAGRTRPATVAAIRDAFKRAAPADRQAMVKRLRDAGLASVLVSLGVQQEPQERANRR